MLSAAVNLFFGPESDAHLEALSTLATKVSQHGCSRIPSILPSIPICPLRSSDLSSQAAGANLAGCMLQVGPQMAPETVNDLGPCLDCQLLAFW